MVRRYTKKNLENWNEKKGKLRAQFVSGFVKPKGRLLDIGGFQGDLKKHISPKIDYYLVDLFAPKKKNFLKYDLNKLGKEKLPYKSKYFDTIVALDIFEHVKYPRKLMDEIRRVLKDDGILITSTHLMATARHYISLHPVFFEEWKTEWRIPISEGIVKREGTIESIITLSYVPTEMLLKLKK